MPDKKLKDNEIIKALEECIELRFDDTEYATVRLDTLTNALDLINRQKAEIESLKHRKTELQIRNQELQHEKSEAIKEFAERLKEKCYEDFQETCEMLSPYVTDDDIDELVK